MTAKIKFLLPLLLLFLLVGCGKSDAPSIEEHNWELTQTLSTSGERLEAPALSCAAQGGILTVTAEDGTIYEGSYALADQSGDSLLYDVTLDGAAGIAVAGWTIFEDGTREETLILSFSDASLYFHANIEK